MLPHRRHISPLDVLLLTVLAGAAAVLAHRIGSDLDYRWNWPLLAQYIIRLDPETGRWTPNLLLQGLITTVRLSIWSSLLAVMLGTLAGLASVSRKLFSRMLGRTYVELIRNMPPLVLVFIFYFAISDQLLPDLSVTAWAQARSAPIQRLLVICFASPGRLAAFFSAVLTLALFEGAYIAEIVRAGIQSIEKGQWEASAGLGMNRWQQMRHVVMPQALQRILPPLSGQFISTIKDSAIVSVISIQELTFQGMQLMSTTYLTFEIWITICLMYLLLTLPCSMAVSRLETLMARR